MSTILIDKSKYDKPIRFSEEGIEIVLHMPMNFIPNSIEGKYIHEQDMIEISFNYNDEEKGMDLLEDNVMKFVVGRESKKILRIIIKKAKEQKINSVTLEHKIQQNVFEAFKNEFRMASDRLNKIIEKQNLEVAKEELFSNADKLLVVQ